MAKTTTKNQSPPPPSSRTYYADRAFEYPYLPRYLYWITRFLDNFINGALSGPQLAQARVHVYGLWCGLILMPIYSVVYALGGGNSFWFHVLMLSVVPIRINQLFRAQSTVDIQSEVIRRITIFNTQIVILSVFTGGLSSPALPWLLSNTFQVGLTLSFRKGSKVLLGTVAALLFVCITHPFVQELNLIPPSLISPLLAVSALFILCQIMFWSTLMQQYRLSFKSLFGPLVRDRTAANNLFWEGVSATLDTFNHRQSTLKFILIKLDVSHKDQSERQHILHLNRWQLGEWTHSWLGKKSTLAEVNQNHLLLIFESIEPATLVAKELRETWSTRARKGCGLEIVRVSDNTPEDVNNWLATTKKP